MGIVIAIACANTAACVLMACFFAVFMNDVKTAAYLLALALINAVMVSGWRNRGDGL